MIDPITVSVLTHRFEAIVQEMGEAMLRTAYSQILNSSRDFSTAICDNQARLVAQAEHVPIHVGAMPWAVASVRDAFAGRTRPGDVFLLNDPYHGNNHLPDLTAFVPVFVEGEVAFWSINRAHQSDIGGSTHGAYNPGATEIWQEGIRITPLKLYDAGELRDDVLQMITTNVRHPHDFMGDLRAMIGSARVGERRLLALVDEYGAKTVIDAVDEILDGAERQARACVRGWKDGVYRGETHPGRRRPRRPRHPHPRDGHQEGRRPRHRPQRLGAPGDRLRELRVPQHDVGRAHGLRVPDRSAHAEELGDVPAGEGHRQAGDDREPQPAGAGDAVDQPLRAGDRRVDHQGADAGRPRARRSPAGAGASASPSRASTRAPSGRSSGTCSTPGPAAAPPSPATAGRRPGRARRPAASSSAAWRSPRRAFR